MFTASLQMENVSLEPWVNRHTLQQVKTIHPPILLGLSPSPCLSLSLFIPSPFYSSVYPFIEKKALL